MSPPIRLPRPTTRGCAPQWEPIQRRPSARFRSFGQIPQREGVRRERRVRSRSACPHSVHGVRARIESNRQDESEICRAVETSLKTDQPSSRTANLPNFARQTLPRLQIGTTRKSRTPGTVADRRILPQPVHDGRIVGCHRQSANCRRDFLKFVYWSRYALNAAWSEYLTPTTHRTLPSFDLVSW